MGGAAARTPLELPGHGGSSEGVWAGLWGHAPKGLGQPPSLCSALSVPGGPVAPLLQHGVEEAVTSNSREALHLAEAPLCTSPLEAGALLWSTLVRCPP